MDNLREAAAQDYLSMVVALIAARMIRAGLLDEEIVQTASADGETILREAVQEGGAPLLDRQVPIGLQEVYGQGVSAARDRAYRMLAKALEVTPEIT